MPRRPRGEGTVVNRFVLAFAALLLPLLVDAQHQHHRNGGDLYGSSPEGGVAGSEALHTLEATRLDIGPAREIETPLLANERRKKTLSSVNNYNNIDHDASAIDLAPAGPAVRAPTPARRPSGETAGLSPPHIARSLEDWEIEDFVLLATIDGKLYARDRKTGEERWALEVDRPMIETTHHRRNRSSVEEDHPPFDDYLWIVEPSRDGSLFVYVPGGAEPGLVNTGLTMKKLVEERSPYNDAESPVVYTGDKRTTMVTLDARTGKVLKWFGSAGALVNEMESCVRSKDLVDPDGDECSTTGTLTLGRTEYTVGIQGKRDGHQIATLRYSEWVPNNYDNDLLRQYRATLDSKYVFSSHDGNVFGYDRAQANEPGRMFKQKFSSPVVRVFDVARPWNTEDLNPDLIVLPQPVPPAEDVTLASMRNSRIFLNHTEDGSWYAMSGNSYPLVIDGPDQAQCDRQDWWQHGPLWDDMNEAQLAKVLVGLHSIEGNRADRLLTISGPSYDEPNGLMSNNLLPAPDESIIGRVRQFPGSAASSLFDFVKNPVFQFVALAILATYWKQIQEWLLTRRAGKMRKAVETREQPISEELAVAEETEETKAGSNEATISKDISPISEGPSDALSAKGVAVLDKAVESIEVQPTPEKKKAHRGRRGGVKHKKGARTNSEDPSKKSEGSNHDEEIPKKPSPTVEDAVRDAKKLGAQTILEPDQQTIPGDVMEVSGPILRMNSLEVNMEKLIGTGSNGTMVFEGKFDGRDVAVKRMLIQFFDIASQETRLLRESDDHPNVIRYFAQQQSHGFLYIALELCPASLADVIDKPHLHRELAENGERDLPDVLYQITNGLQHLHNLRIVHRDLKPQNILVARGKHGKPRLLVSDFGLCKKLEGEQSSFRATTAHAAGTSGWRAPELLLDDDARESGTTIDGSTHSGSGTVLVSSDIMPNRRATRAIDIFSLGLVFFYVLTKGSHPFDCGDRYMREVNIRKGNHNLRPLEVLGDYTFEAKDLIGSMLEQEPKRRPNARQVMAHPFFWSAKKRLNFLCDVSDHFEKEKRDPPSPALQELERWASDVCRGDFLKYLGKEFVESMGKQRKYTGSRLLDLLRALRNKKNHYEDMSDKLKKDVGPLPDGYLSFWTRRFPDLLITCWNVVYDVQWDEIDRFREYYEPAGL